MASRKTGKINALLRLHVSMSHKLQVPCLFSDIMGSVTDDLMISLLFMIITGAAAHFWKNSMFSFFLWHKAIKQISHEI